MLCKPTRTRNTSCSFSHGRRLLTMPVEKERSMLRTSFIHTDRPDSSQLVDLHVYALPKIIWKNRQNLAENEAMEQAISLGFVRVSENLTIYELRQYIHQIWEDEEHDPQNFIYLRCVGRCLTKVKPHQETELRVKNYRPPRTVAPEIYLLKEDNEHDDDEEGSLKSNDESIRSYPVRVYQEQESEENGNRNYQKMQEEQDRLHSRQVNLARQRTELEDRQTAENSPQKGKKVTIKIQRAYPGFLERPIVTKEDENTIVELEPIEKKETPNQHPQKATQEKVKAVHRLGELKCKRFELENERENLLRRIQSLYSQVAVRRKEERDAWKQRYFLEKKKTNVLTERNQMAAKNRTELHSQYAQMRMRLYKTTKLREGAENECRLLKEELQQIRSTMNTLEKYEELKESLQQPPPNDPISFNITLQY